MRQLRNANNVLRIFIPSDEVQNGLFKHQQTAITICPLIDLVDGPEGYISSDEASMIHALSHPGSPSN